MEQNTDQTVLLKALYQDYLSENIQLKEERALLRLQVSELEARLAEAGEPGDTEDNS